jgi:Fe-S cluster assembly protein SufD
MEKGLYNNFYQYLIGYFEKEIRNGETNEPPGIRIKRANAFQEFSLKGLPSNRHEEWKYTNLNRLLKEEFKLQPDKAELDTGPQPIPGLEACRIILLNGRLLPEISDPLPEGVRFFDTAAAMAEPRYAEKLGEIARTEDSPVLALNTAFFKEFQVLHISGSKPVETPVHLIHYYSESSTPRFIPYRMLVIAEPLSEATIIETFSSAGQQPILISYVSEQEIAESAVLHSFLLNELEDDGYFIHYREVRQGSNSQVNQMNLALGNGSLVRNDLNFRLQGSGTQTNLWGSYVVSDRQHIDNHTLVDHQQPHCNSTEHYKGILQDRSHAVFSGKVFVRPDAQKTNAFQQNNNVLLSDQATVNSKPQLEIFADDVKCSHGSTVGQLNAEALFYLKTRGISEEMAKRMLIEAFVAQIHSRITLPPLKDHIHRRLTNKLQSENLITA